MDFIGVLKISKNQNLNKFMNIIILSYTVCEVNKFEYK